MDQVNPKWQHPARAADSMRIRLRAANTPGATRLLVYCSREGCSRTPSPLPTQHTHRPTHLPRTPPNSPEKWSRRRLGSRLMAGRGAAEGQGPALVRGGPTLVRIGPALVRGRMPLVRFGPVDFWRALVRAAAVEKAEDVVDEDVPDDLQPHLRRRGGYG